MEVSQYGLAQMLLAALICGLALGLLYDVLCLTRMCLGDELGARARSWKARLALPQRFRYFKTDDRKPKSQKLTALAKYLLLFAEDVLFCLLIGVVLALLLYRTNDGQFRMSAAVMLLVGLIGYLATVGRLVRRVLGVIVVIIRALLIRSVAILVYPIVCLARWLARWTQPLRTRFKEKYRHLKQSFADKKNTRAVRKQHQENVKAVPPPGKHYFSTGGGKRSDVT